MAVYGEGGGTDGQLDRHPFPEREREREREEKDPPKTWSAFSASKSWPPPSFERREGWRGRRRPISFFISPAGFGLKLLVVGQG